MNPQAVAIGTLLVGLLIILFFVFRSMTVKTPEAHFSVFEFLIKVMYSTASFIEALAEGCDSFLMQFRETYNTKIIRSRAEEYRKVPLKYLSSKEH